MCSRVSENPGLASRDLRDCSAFTAVLADYPKDCV